MTVQQTSRDAFHNTNPVREHRHHRVLRLLRAAGEIGMTDLEIADALDDPINVIPAARGRLVEAGVIADSGRTRCKPGKTYKSIVWVYVGAGALKPAVPVQPVIAPHQPALF